MPNHYFLFNNNNNCIYLFWKYPLCSVNDDKNEMYNEKA